jgi:hypothetical protein
MTEKVVIIFEIFLVPSCLSTTFWTSSLAAASCEVFEKKPQYSL